ncbi:MAG: energy transducer TonB [Salinivirgaceae bacterium]|nr:energy transducer TonB [Salinivirgaceae bacterium]
MNTKHIFQAILAFALAAICTTGYAQSNSANNGQIIVPKDSTANPDQPIIDDDNTIYTSVKIMPEFPGGEAAMKKYFADSLQSWESKKFISGKVFVQVVIGKDGMVEPENVKITSDLEPVVNEKVVSLVKSMPKWTPGMRYESKSGKVVKVLARVSMNIPVELSVKGEEQEQVFFIVEHMPEFPGGDVEMRKFIAENTKYPEEAKAKGLSGKVFVQFVINKEGDVVNAKIARGVDPILDNEAIRVVLSMPKWKPGEQSKRIDGEKVWVPKNVSFTVPVNFSL